MKKFNDDFANLLLFNLLDKVNNLLLSGLTGDEVIQVSHDVHADLASQLIAGLRGGRGSEHQAGEEN
jgi:hypothetical protein